VTVQDAMVNFNNSADPAGVMEIYCESNIPINQSIDTETYSEGNFDGQVYNKLVTFQTDRTQNTNRLRPNAFIEFDAESIPERIEWAIWKRSGNGSVIEPMDSATAYNFITLKIEVYK
jgi:hypothetical protein